MPKRHELVCPPDEAPARLDVFLARKLPEHSREYLKTLVESGRVTVGGRPAKPSHKLRGGEPIVLEVPDPVRVELPPEPTDLDICFEDRHLLVVNKPRGMLTHPTSAARPTGSLVNALLAHCTDLAGINGELRPGIVHRLDRDTSGLLVIAKQDQILRDLAAQLKARAMVKQYVALARGRVQPASGSLRWPIGRHPVVRNKMRVDEDRGRVARTDYRVAALYAAASLVWVRLHSGRTHQIRVHFCELGFPLVGDVLYASKREASVFKGVALHSARLAFRHPATGEWMRFSRPVPADMAGLIRRAAAGDPLTPDT